MAPRVVLIRSSCTWCSATGRIGALLCEFPVLRVEIPRPAERAIENRIAGDGTTRRSSEYVPLDQRRSREHSGGGWSAIIDLLPSRIGALSLAPKRFAGCGPATGVSASVPNTGAVRVNALRHLSR